MSGESSLFKGYVSVPGTQLYYEVEGEGAPLVFLHAGVADSRMWRFQRNAFSADYRAVVYDLRGFGKSPMVAGAFAHHQDLESLLDRLGIGAAYLVGASIGAGIALDFALSRPDRVWGLVLISPGVGGYEDWSPEMLRFWDEEEDAFGRADAQAVVDLNLRMWLAGPRRRLQDVPERLRKRVTEMLLQSFLASEVAGEPHELEPPALERLDEIDVPTLIVEGALDVPDIRRIASRLEHGIRGARRAVVEDAAHLLTLESPSRFNALLQDFLEACEAERRVLELRLAEVRLPVSRFEQCLRFYRDVLGMEPAAGGTSPESVTFQTAGGIPITLVRAASSNRLEPPNGTALVVRVPDVDRAVEALRARGIRGLSDAADDAEGGWRRAHLRDPEGHRLELVSKRAGRR